MSGSKGRKTASGWRGEDEECAPGTTIGIYKLGEKLGKGAFATVYKALDTESGDFVAVKRISKAKVHGKTQQQRVLAEGQVRKKKNRRIKEEDGDVVCIAWRGKSILLFFSLFSFFFFFFCCFCFCSFLDIKRCVVFFGGIFV